MSNRKRMAITVVIAISLICCLGVILVIVKTNLVRRLYNNLILDNRDHFLSCEELPPLSEVTMVVESHANVIEEIKRVNPGFVVVRIDSTICPGKADIVIEYPSHQNRLAIEEIIDGETFFDVPYRLRNY